MGFFSNVFESIQQRIQESQQRKKEEKEVLRKLELQAQEERRQAFTEEFKKDVKIVAIARAKKDAAKKSGLQKLRAEERVRNLQGSGSEPGSFFDKFGSYTQKNLAKREENLKRTEEARQTAKKMRDQRLLEQQRLRQERMEKSGSKTFGR